MRMIIVRAMKSKSRVRESRKRSKYRQRKIYYKTKKVAYISMIINLIRSSFSRTRKAKKIDHNFMRKMPNKPLKLSI